MLSPHGAAVNLRAAAKAQAVVAIAVTKPQPLCGFVELVLPGNEKANYEAPIYARTSGYLKCWLADIGTTKPMTPVSRTI
jgi:membrane fusion protein (multidrug efflux system)